MKKKMQWSAAFGAVARRAMSHRYSPSRDGQCAEIGIDDFQSSRSPDGKYRTTPLRGLFARSKSGFYHDGRFADLPAVVSHYERVFKLSLSEGERRDLAEYLKSL